MGRGSPGWIFRHAIGFMILAIIGNLLLIGGAVFLILYILQQFGVIAS